MEANKIEKSECPVCGVSVKMSSIQQHVNDCLNEVDSVEVLENSKKRKSEEMSPIPSSSWGSLLPSSSKKENESSVISKQSASKRFKTAEKSTNSLKRSASPIVIDENSNSSEVLDMTESVVDSAKDNKKCAPNQSLKTGTGSGTGGPGGSGAHCSESDSDSDNDSREFINSNSKQKSFFQKKKEEFNSKIGQKGNGFQEETKKRVDKSSNISTMLSATQNPFFQKKTPNSVSSKSQFSPLAEQMRPKNLDNYIGQEKAVGEKSLLYSLLRSDQIPSMILWGPPGCGKTTLARIIANLCKEKGSAKFVQLSATTSGVNDVKEVIKVAKNDQKMLRRKTVLFLDEIHRFNKSQQDSLLPHVEDGTIALIGATTENPSFQVNNALLSRCRVIVLEKLSSDSLQMIIKRALKETGVEVYDTVDDINYNDSQDSLDPVVWIENQAIEVLSNLCDGDARASLNGLQMALQACKASFKNDSRGDSNVVMVTSEHIKQGLQKSHVQYDKSGEERYNIVSALHKSIRGSDASAALYWLARMLEGGEEPLYVARRLVRAASEDIGLADPAALTQSVAAFQACHLMGMPECEVILAQCTIYLARAPKSVEVLEAYTKAKQCIKDHKGPLPGVPLHLRNASTKLMKSLGYGKGYKYNPAFTDPVEQDYLPGELLGTDFFT